MRTHSTIRPVLVHDKNCLDVSALSSELHGLCRTVPWRGFLAIAGDWLIIATAIVAAKLAHHWLAALCALVVIGSRQHALLILMHDASHFRIHPRKKINDVLANCFLAWPCFISVEAYRAHHYEHHVHVNTDEDPDWLRKKDNPDWAFPKKQWHILLIFLRAALYTEAGEIVKALIFRPFLRKCQPTAAEGDEAKGTAAKPPKSRLKLAYYLSLVAILTAFGWWS
ncbi:MAG: fatty acid desaturase, partial [Verrucomicrobia bacterium]|nr:fatty acid desaturase [Verrucomicrobiota bacterium]